MASKRYIVEDVEGDLSIRETRTNPAGEQETGESYDACRERMLRILAQRIATATMDMRRLLSATTFKVYEQIY